MGIKFNLIGGRVIGTPGYYETSQTNSNRAPLTRFSNGAAAIHSALGSPPTALAGRT